MGLRAWNFIKAVTAGAVAVVKSILNWFASLPGLFAGWFGEAKDWVVRKFTELTAWLSGLPGRALAALSGLVTSLRTAASNGFNAFKSAATTKASEFLSWVKGLPGRISRGIGSLSGLLVSKGKDVIRGLWNGIKSMGGWLKDQLIGFAKTMIPGPIADALGIGSPSKVMAKEVGRWVPPGIVEGAEDATPAMDKALRGLVDVPGLTAAGRSSGTSAASATRVLIEVAGPEAVKRLIRTIVANDGGGNVQKAFGQ
ncbi:phage tail protein [Streptomyces sp. GTA36]